MLQQRRFQQPKPKDGLKAEAYAILSYFRRGVLIPSGQIERQLRKLKGIKEITVNPVSHAVKICYDPNIVTMEKVRRVLKQMDPGRQHI